MTGPARVLDRYEILRPLGRGGFGRTYLARDLRLERDVALKVLHPQGAGDLKAFELFEREAAVLRELRHPGVPAVHASFRAPWEGTEAAFLVMEFVDGVTLESVIADRRHLDPDSILHLFVEALGLLDYLHSRVPPVLHRDIKPANLILRPDGSPALVDFGAVRNVFLGPEESGSTVVGTYGYMPYEQYMGQASPASDLYALGATFLHLVTGRAPPEFLTSAGRLEVPAPLPCGDGLRAVLGRMLALAPADRFQSAREARAALLGATSARAVVLTDEARVAGREPGGLMLGAVPRAVTGPVADLLDRVAYTPWQLMEGETPSERASVVDIVLVAFFSVITLGIMPAMFWSRARARRRRLARFFTEGAPAPARILEKVREQVEFGAKLVRVRYEFEADGSRRRGSDQVLPLLAERWDVGDTIQVLYLADRDFDSVIISTS